MKFGIALGRLNPAFWVEAACEAERLGFESVWMPEHLVLPVDMAGSPRTGEEHPPVAPQTPVFDAFAYLSFLAGKTSSIRLATHVYNLALRHPFVAARAVTTLDVVSGGRAITGVGAGWLASEWRAAGLDFRTRGRRLNEALEVCVRLWTEKLVEHHGEFFDFAPVAFEPKPVQRPHPPVHIGGMSEAALRRAGRSGDGWIAMSAEPETIAGSAARLRELRAASGRGDLPFEVSVGAAPANREEVNAWRDADPEFWPRSRGWRRIHPCAGGGCRSPDWHLLWRQRADRTRLHRSLKAGPTRMSRLAGRSRIPRTGTYKHSTPRARRSLPGASSSPA